MKVLAREGNTLSPVIRNAWDGKTLQTLAKNSPLRATGAHIGIVGHITNARTAASHHRDPGNDRTLTVWRPASELTRTGP
jgi:hypothetical protein